MVEAVILWLVISASGAPGLQNEPACPDKELFAEGYTKLHPSKPNVCIKPYPKFSNVIVQ